MLQGRSQGSSRASRDPTGSRAYPRVVFPERFVAPSKTFLAGHAERLLGAGPAARETVCAPPGGLRALSTRGATCATADGKQVHASEALRASAAFVDAALLPLVRPNLRPAVSVSRDARTH
mmetsp:Transcript_3008/g.7763  ORF Transcript_3008/g.7763 Transcript_3008/m.7763 type:complete len:121 (-) Transcript_3008:432-794(-)